MNKFKEIRPIVLGLAIKDNKLLVSEGFDNVKKQTFYRCLGELMGLEWQDVDFRNGIISINRSSQYLSDMGEPF